MRAPTRDHLVALYRDHVHALTQAYSAALAAHGYDAVVLHSGRAKKRTEFDDQYWPHRPVPHFQHWAPIADPDAYVVVEQGKGARLTWPVCTSFWEKPLPPESDHFLEALDVSRDALPALPSGKKIALVAEDPAVGPELGIADVNPPSLVAALDALRTKKTDYEVLCIAEANRRAALGHDAVREAFFGERGLSELELHLVYLRATRQDDPETPYKNIVALDDNGAVLHHVGYGRDVPAGESLLLDAGATYLAYCSDITRTWVKPRGESGATFKGLVDAMEEMQRGLCASITSGHKYEALHDASHRGVSKILSEAGLVKASAEETDEKGISRAFYPHGLGHSLGLQCHDVGCATVKPRADNPFLRNTSVIEPKQVFTIEPGLYFIDGLLAELRRGPHGALVDWTAVEALSRYGGIRIEDDVLVTEGGIHNMTRELLPRGGGGA